jgi:general stress protein 26
VSEQYDTEREVGREEGEAHREEIRQFMADRDGVAKYLVTLRKDGRPLARPVGAFLEGWTIYTVTEDIHPKTLQIRRNPVVAYIFSGMTGRERGNDPVSVFVQGRAELIEDQAEVADLFRRREAATGTGRGHPSEDRLFVIRTAPEYLRAEGFTGRRRPVIYRDFPGVAAVEASS